jgi:hypothetical protein
MAFGFLSRQQNHSTGRGFWRPCARPELPAWVRRAGCRDTATRFRWVREIICRWCPHRRVIDRRNRQWRRGRDRQPQQRQPAGAASGWRSACRMSPGTIRVGCSQLRRIMIRRGARMQSGGVGRQCAADAARLRHRAWRRQMSHGIWPPSGDQWPPPVAAGSGGPGSVRGGDAAGPVAVGHPGAFWSRVQYVQLRHRWAAAILIRTS